MDLNNFAVFRMISGKMDWLGQRQRVLAENIAHSDTPDYRANDLKEVDFRKQGPLNPFRVQLARTHDSHLLGAGASDTFSNETSRMPYEVTPTGNSVVIEEQVIKAGETASDYKLMVNLYRKHVQMFRIALGRGNG